MRFDSIVKFWEDGSHYDPDSGEYVDGTDLLAILGANVTDMGTTTSNELLGDYKQRSKVVRTFEDAPDDWTYLTIGDSSKHYKQLTGRDPLKNHTMIVGEDNGE
ncbi:hypothetical protein [Lactobacillus selangorensis]|uniref:hypothetical protein n=1 Tax=Lactobacillus selangorensis TaxID=81857 RepID=UPI00070ECFC4|nr:hypothetical protein [Lactobacillus selangorensis]